MTEPQLPTDPVSDEPAIPEAERGPETDAPPETPAAEPPVADEAPEQRDRLRELISQKRGEREQFGKRREQEERRRR